MKFMRYHRQGWFCRPTSGIAGQGRIFFIALRMPFPHFMPLYCLEHGGTCDAGPALSLERGCRLAWFVSIAASWLVRDSSVTEFGSSAAVKYCLFEHIRLKLPLPQPCATEKNHPAGVCGSEFRRRFSSSSRSCLSLKCLVVYSLQGHGRGGSSQEEDCGSTGITAFCQTSVTLL